MDTDDHDRDGGEDESGGDGDRSMDNDTKQEADFSPEGARPKTLGEWIARGQAIAEYGVSGIIELTEREYIPFGEVARAIEKYAPWKIEGVTKAVWAKEHSHIRKMSSTHWNQCADLFDRRGDWPEAKTRYLTRNDGWEPAHSSSPLFARDLIRDYTERDLPDDQKTKAKKKESPHKLAVKWRERFFIAFEEGKKIAAVNDFRSSVLQTLDAQLKQEEAALEDDGGGQTDTLEAVEERIRRASAIKPPKEKSAQAEAYDRLLADYEAAMERFEVAKIELRPISPDFKPTAVEITTKLRQLKDAEARAAAEQSDTESQQKAGFSSNLTKAETAPTADAPEQTGGRPPSYLRPVIEPGAVATLKEMCDEAVEFSKGWRERPLLLPAPEPVKPPVAVAAPVPPVVTMTAPANAATVETAPKRGAKRKPILTAEKLKEVAKRAVKGLREKEAADLTCAVVRDHIDPVWRQIVKDECEGYLAAFTRYLLTPLRETVAPGTDKSTPPLGEFNGESVVWSSPGNWSEVLTWSEANGFTIREITSPDGDDPSSGGSGHPTTTAQESPDDGAAGEASVGVQKEGTPPATGPEGKWNGKGSRNAALTLTTIDQLTVALDPALQILRALPPHQISASHVRWRLEPILRKTAPDLRETFIELANLADISTGRAPDEANAIWWAEGQVAALYRDKSGMYAHFSFNTGGNGSASVNARKEGMPPETASEPAYDEKPEPPPFDPQPATAAPERGHGRSSGIRRAPDDGVATSTASPSLPASRPGRVKGSKNNSVDTPPDRATLPRDTIIQSIAATLHGRLPICLVTGSPDGIRIDAHTEDKLLFCRGMLKPHPEIADTFSLRLLAKHEGRHLTEQGEPIEAPRIKDITWDLVFGAEAKSALVAECKIARAKAIRDPFIGIKDGRLNLTGEASDDAARRFALRDLEWLLRKDMVEISFIKRGVLGVRIATPFGEYEFFVRGRPT